MRYPNLVPECNVDTAFVEMLGYLTPNHAQDIFQVCIILKKKQNTICIGFIDDDKKKPAYVSSFKMIDTSTYFSILKHQSLNQFLVVAKPAMDKVIFNLCKDLNINLSSYGLPKDFNAFLEVTKRVSIKNDKNFKNLLNSIKQKKSQDVEMIKSFVSKYF